MTYLAVTRERGPAWDAARPLAEQERWDQHAAFMNGLVDDGFVVFGGPLGDEDSGDAGRSAAAAAPRPRLRQ